MKPRTKTGCGLLIFIAILAALCLPLATNQAPESGDIESTRHDVASG